MKLVLASSSPRRSELLAAIGIVPDQIIAPDVDETPRKGEVPWEYSKRIAILKARTVHEAVKDAYVLAADTIVERNRKIILKAEDDEEARQILKAHSGRRQRVFTSVCVISPTGKEACRTVKTRLSFKRLTAEEIEEYVVLREWEGKSGAYDIRGMAAKFVKFMSGSQTNVIGLPLYETDCLLKGLGFSKK
jgi:septum formation protein